MTTIWLIIRYDFDSMENHLARARTWNFVGWAPSPEDADTYISKARKDPLYKGWDGEMYPQWMAVPVESVPEGNPT